MRWAAFFALAVRAVTCSHDFHPVPERKFHVAAPGQWKLRAAASEHDGRVEIKMTCTSWGSATTDLGRVEDGLWRLVIDYHGNECEEAVHGRLWAIAPGVERRVLADGMLYELTQVTARCPIPIALNKQERVVLEVEASGGLGCWGPLVVTRAALEPATRFSWSEDECRALGHELSDDSTFWDRTKRQRYLALLPPP